MSPTATGAAAGAVLALTWILVGFWAFVLVALAMLLGAAVGRVAEGRLDLRALADAFRGRRSSS
ncbi:DUF2273 domain-containing protein [Myceligenerans xiligouense]|uniref:Small integral membrane protein DUF2273 n=1 Tax=Myceligenerans xiligouense TaxID=253184 RepID=A0A3N4ZJ15_9MICO|nr:DUF2273 domain-containing protein [Myceligenerans xiligouense]RPF20885.1 small integral membrane protein DUF2273 [Myceligenerans xiligouense]